jgi:prepilin-type N-terminal cleavage/methylation domain-containing protein
MSEANMKKNASGFTLAEMAIVLVIVGLLIGGLLVPLTTQIEQRRVGETQKALDEIKEALIGFAVANGRLPRPATAFNNGAENPAACATEAACTGFIPWSTLGITKLDAWNKIIRYSVTPAFANAAFTLTTVATKTVQTRDNGGALVYLAGQAACAVATQCMPAVIFSSGKNNWGTGDAGGAFGDNSATNIDEDTNNGASLNFINRITTTNTAAATGGEFDDVVTWVPLNTLFNRMVAAQKLP